MPEEAVEEWEISEEIVVVRGSSDILSPLYVSPFSDGSCEYPTVEHYCQCQILTHVGLVAEAQQILDIKTAVEAAGRGWKLVRDSMPPGSSPAYAQTYVSVCRDSFLREGYKHRNERDEDFREALKGTGQSLLVSCDKHDMEDGVGMDESDFWVWIQKEQISSKKLFKWIKQRRTEAGKKPLGKNRLGKILMSIRDGKEWPAGSAADDTDLLPASYSEPMGDESQQRLFELGELKVSEQIIALEGIFQPLSNLYPTPLIINGKKYRSVEHYAYFRLFNMLKLGDKAMEKLRTTSNPAKIRSVATKVLEENGKSFEDEKIQQVWGRSEKWYRRAVNTKLTQYGGLKKLLLSTGHALLIETTNPEDTESSIVCSEREMQHLLTKKYVDPKTLLEWMTSDEAPKKVSHIGRNQTGLRLMSIRRELSESQSETETGLMPLILPADSAIYGLLSEHMICFTAESVFHPSYDAVVTAPTDFSSVQHFVIEQGARYFDFPSATIADLRSEDRTGMEAWQEFRFHVEERCPPVEQLFAWEYSGQVEAAKAGLRFRFQQNQALLRALLDTGEALLVYCKRYESRSCEWSVGLRERDLRGWMHTLGMDTRSLAQLCSRPLSRRPSFLGGNRMGFLLMELRREFTLAGVFSQDLPLLPMGPDRILGSESLMEDVDLPSESEFEYSLWPNPLLLSAKAEDNEELWEKTQAKQKERVWREESKEEEGASEPVRPMEETLFTPLKFDKDELNEMDEMGLRIFIMEYVSKLRGIQHAREVQDQRLAAVESDLGKFRAFRGQMLQTMSFQPPSGPPPSIQETIEGEQKMREQSIKNKLAELIQRAATSKPSEARVPSTEPNVPVNRPDYKPQNAENRQNDSPTENEFIPVEEYFKEVSLDSNGKNRLKSHSMPTTRHDFQRTDIETGELSSDGEIP